MLWDLYKVLRIPALHYTKREALELGRDNLHSKLAKEDLS